MTAVSTAIDWDEWERQDYYGRLKMMASVKRPKPRPLAEPAIDEFRSLPMFPGYLIHGSTREVWSVPRQIVRSDGQVRNFDAKLIKPSDGRLSLSVDGVKTTHTVASLWRAAFPEAAESARAARYARAVRRCHNGHPLENVAYWGSFNRVCLLCFPDFGEPGERLTRAQKS